MTEMSLIGLGGYAESGKDALADILVDEFDWVKDYMSRSLEEALLTLNPIIPLQFVNPPGFDIFEAYHIEYFTYQQYHSVVGYAQTKTNPEVRRLLQTLGTEIGRNMFGEDCWVRYVEKKIHQGLEAGYKIAVTGIRHKNELAMIKRHGGSTIWMERGGQPVNSHSSDNTLGPDDFDIVIDNTGALEDLRALVLENFA